MTRLHPHDNSCSHVLMFSARLNGCITSRADHGAAAGACDNCKGEGGRSGCSWRGLGQGCTEAPRHQLGGEAGGTEVPLGRGGMSRGTQGGRREEPRHPPTCTRPMIQAQGAWLASEGDRVLVVR